MLSPIRLMGLRNLTSHRSRTILMLIAMIVGMVGFGSITDSYAILTREMDRSYMETSPASFVLRLSGEQDADHSVSVLKRVPGVADAVSRTVVPVRVKAKGGHWAQGDLFLVNTLTDMRLDKAWPGKGAPTHNGLLVERAAFRVIGAGIGDDLEIRTNGKIPLNIRIAGSIHAPGLPPAWMENKLFAFLEYKEAARLGITGGTTELRATITGNRFRTASIAKVADTASTALNSAGIGIAGVEIPPPGKHPHADQMESLLYFLQAFGLMAMLLSGVLVANGFSGMMAGEIPNIGILKAIGGGRQRIMAGYMSAVALLDLAAFVMGYPAAVHLGRAYADFAANILNFDIASHSLPIWVPALEAAVALLIPLAAAIFPIYKGTRITAREALNSKGTVDTRVGRSFMPRALGERITGPMRIAILNTTRNRSRLALTLITLTLGGAGFMTAMDINASITNTITKTFRSMDYDAGMVTTAPFDIERALGLLEGTPGVSAVESWNVSVGQGSDGYIKGLAKQKIIGIPWDSQLYKPRITKGRWFEPGERNGIILNHALAERTGLGVGERITLDLADGRHTFGIVGIAREVGTEPRAFVLQGTLQGMIGKTGKANMLLIRLSKSKDMAPALSGHAAMLQHLFGKESDDKGPTMDDALDGIEGKLQTAGIIIAERYPTSRMMRSMQDHLKIIANLILLMSVLIMAVGGLGLASTIGTNVLERRREIGMMRAIGASKGSIYRIILGEAGTIGLISWLMAVISAIPLSYMLGNTFARIFLHTNLDIAINPHGFLLWLVMVLGISALSGLYPAKRAVSTPVREVLNMI